MTGCACELLVGDVVDTTLCRIHPLYCEAVHPVFGVGCHHEPGHDGEHRVTQFHAWDGNGPTTGWSR